MYSPSASSFRRVLPPLVGVGVGGDGGAALGAGGGREARKSSICAKVVASAGSGLLYGKATPEPWTAVPSDIKAELDDLYTFAKSTTKAYAAGGYTNLEATDPQAHALNKAAQKVVKELDGGEDAPDNGTHRKWMRSVMDAAQARLRKAGIKITNADLQAVLWFHEKDLYTRFGATSSKGDRADYVDAADIAIARYRSDSAKRGGGLGGPADTRGPGDAAAARRARLAEQPDLFGGLAQSEAYEFVSPNNRDTDMTFDEARAELASQGQQDFRDYVGRVDAIYSPGADVRNALGDWRDGAENTTVTRHKGDISYEDLRVSTALKSAYRQQKMGIPFMVDPEGGQFLYEFKITGKTLREARDMVEAAGIENRTLDEQKDGVTVYVFDAPETPEAGAELRDKIEKLVTKNKYDYTYKQGRGEFLGSWTSREEGHAIFREVVGRRIEGAGMEGSEGRGDGGRTAGLRGLAREAGLLHELAGPLFSEERRGDPTGDLGRDGAALERSGRGPQLTLAEPSRAEIAGVPVDGEIGGLGIFRVASDSTEHRETFAQSLAVSSDSRPNGEQVTKKTADQLKGAQLFLALDGKFGFAIYPTGEIGSFFSHKDTGKAGALLMAKALQHLKANPTEGLWASSFNTNLVPAYTRYGGFRPVARVEFSSELRPAWDVTNKAFEKYEGGRPSIVFYKLDPANAKDMTPEDVLREFPQALPYKEAQALASGPKFSTEVEAKAFSAVTGEPVLPGFSSASHAHDFVSDNFYQAVSDVGGGLDLVANYTLSTAPARYVVSGPQGGNYIEYNPRTLAGRTQEQVRAVMRQELVHAVSGAVLANRNPGVTLEKAWTEFYTDLDNSLTSAQKNGLTGVYGSVEAGHARAAEYFRVALEKLHYGTITEAEMKTTAMQKIVALLKDVVSYFSGKTVSSETKAVFDETAAMLRKVDPQASIPDAPMQSEKQSNNSAGELSNLSIEQHHERLSNKGVDPITGGVTNIGKLRRGGDGSGHPAASRNEGPPTRGSDFPDAVRAGDRRQNSGLEKARQRISALIPGASLAKQGEVLMDYAKGLPPDVAANAGKPPMQSEPARTWDPRNLDSNGQEAQDNPFVQMFRPKVFKTDERAVTRALDRVRNAPEFANVAQALAEKTYFQETAKETTELAHSYLAEHGDDCRNAHRPRRIAWTS